MFTGWFNLHNNDQKQLQAFDTNGELVQEPQQMDERSFRCHGLDFTAQRKELARLKTIKQICLILGIIFSIIGLISMCNHPIEMKDDSSVARKMEIEQLQKIDS